MFPTGRKNELEFSFESEHLLRSDVRTGSSFCTHTKQQKPITLASFSCINGMSGHAYTLRYSAGADACFCDQ